MTSISKIKINYCRFPLKIGYKLSFGTVNTFDTVILEIKSDDGQVGFGEATFLPDYGSEDSDEAFNNSKIIGEQIVGMDTQESLSTLNDYYSNNPFLISAFCTAMENLSRQYSNKSIKVPIIGLMNEITPEAIEENIENLINMGYKAIKIKIGFNSLENDLKKLDLIDKYSEGKFQIRVDANQSLENFDVDIIINKFSSINMQYLEQPFKSNNFEKHLRLNEKSPFPIMLDESIWGFKDIDKVYEKAISEYIKLKLLKCGGLSQFESMINYVKERKIKIIIGNGVQTDLNCILEAQIFDKCNLMEAAENIGFSKLEMPITKNEIIIDNGNMVVQDKPIELNIENINKFTKSKLIIPE